MAGYLDKIKALEQSNHSSVASGGAASDGPGGGLHQPTEYCEISEISEIRVGDGQPPPLARPPTTREETARLLDYLGDPEAFTRWLEWAMAYFDPAEMDSNGNT